MLINSKSQTWSADIVLAVVIFMGTFVIFYVILYQNPNANVSNLKDQASTVIRQISSGDSSIKILNKNDVNVSKINELKNLSYDNLKQMLRVEGDFCIYIEDGTGNVVLINNSYRSVGSSSINISGTPCGQT